jgi:hypothetical protein
MLHPTQHHCEPGMLDAPGLHRFLSYWSLLGVMDTPFGGTPESAYAMSGIEEAVRSAGAKWR